MSDSRVGAVHASYGETAADTVIEPDEVAIGVEGDSSDFVEGDARVFDIVSKLFAAIEADETGKVCCAQPYVVFGIDFDVMI